VEVFELLHRAALLIKTAAAILAGGATRPAVNVLQDASDILGDALDRIHTTLEDREEPAQILIHPDHHQS
jgi:hypothetical protein